MPIKFEHVVFTKLAPLQRSIYDVFLTSPDIKRLLRGQGSQPLKVRFIIDQVESHAHNAHVVGYHHVEKVVQPSWASQST